MSFRYMRVIVLFDLPTETAKDLREYRLFRTFLIKSGFIMMQESVYTKLAINPSVAELVKNQVRKSLPSAGLVQMLTITEKQFQSMELLLGDVQSVYCDSTDRVVEL